MAICVVEIPKAFNIHLHKGMGIAVFHEIQHGRARVNDLIRPALYNATHDIIPLIKKSSRNFSSHDFVGPICETSDRFLKTKNYQKINEGDNLAIKDVGAYGIVLSSNYNLRPRPVEIIIKNSKIKKISKKQRLNDII